MKLTPYTNEKEYWFLLDSISSKIVHGIPINNPKETGGISLGIAYISF